MVIQPTEKELQSQMDKWSEMESVQAVKVSAEAEQEHFLSQDKKHRLQALEQQLLQILL